MTSHAPTVQFRTNSPDATLELGQRLGRSLVGGLVVALVGDLGAGKTQLVKGVAVGNGAKDKREVTSPTFTLINEYAGRLTLFHIDAYRLHGAVELLALGFDELIATDTAVAVEWADRVADAITDEHLRVQIASEGANLRQITFTAHGPAALACLQSLAACEV